jgi:hypothetical protein
LDDGIYINESIWDQVLKFVNFSFFSFSGRGRTATRLNNPQIMKMLTGPILIGKYWLLVTVRLNIILNSCRTYAL